MSEQLFNKKDISEILKKASEIQTQKDLYGDKEGLTEEELIALANEVGIDKDSVLQALQNKESASFDHRFNWFKGTSKVQNIITVDGEISNENWDEVIREIRKVVGGIGKDSNQRNSYEWEQRMKDIGYRHISLTPQDGKTRIQYVFSWTGIRFIAAFLGFMLLFTATAISFDGTDFPFGLAIAISSVAGSLGVFMSRFFLKPFFEKQKRVMQNTLQAIANKVKGTSKGSISIEEDAYSPEEIRAETPKQGFQKL